MPIPTLEERIAHVLELAEGPMTLSGLYSRFAGKVGHESFLAAVERLVEQGHVIHLQAPRRDLFKISCLRGKGPAASDHASE